MFAVAVLDALLRTHDDRPDEAIARLPGLFASPDLSAAALSRAAWLANHLLGEKKGGWRGAWVLLKKLPLAEAGAAMAAPLRGGRHPRWGNRSPTICARGSTTASGGQKKSRRGRLVKLQR
ncbi:hypothetical protein [Chromobacterium phragmitis]|uniref:hypothetical protein n=1 Tax=Chromobacterium phragmitis TaxID=2202141 RepID=UPI0011AE8BD7|nr:hypothetical protein [Chromobacterium phragmitis]